MVGELVISGRCFTRVGGVQRQVTLLHAKAAGSVEVLLGEGESAVARFAALVLIHLFIFHVCQFKLFSFLKVRENSNIIIILLKFHQVQIFDSLYRNHKTSLYDSNISNYRLSHLSPQ